MAISREDFFDAKSKGALWDVGVSIKRGNPLPLDADSVFDSLQNAQAYATGVLSYPGQVLAVVAEDATTIYYLDNECNVVEVGGKVEVDGKSIELVGGKVAVKGVAAAELGAILTAQGDGTVAWVKPDATTVEGLQQSVATLQQSVGTLTTTVGNEGSGLVKQVNDLSTNLSTNYYTKPQVEGLVSGAFHFKGEAQKFEDGNIYVDNEILSSMKAGDVYQVGDKEYVYTGEEWIELGFTIDLSNYATQSYVNSQIGATKTELQGYADQAETDAIAAAKSYTDGKIAPLATTESVTSAIEAAKTELKSYADQAESDAVSTAGTQADSKIAAKVGELGEEYTTVKAYVDAKDSALDSKITALSGKFDGLGDLASLDEVTESNLNAALAAKINGKADKATTLAGYGISDAYTKAEADGAISTAKGQAVTEAGTQADSKIAAKVGEITGTVKAYVDGKESTLNGKITTIETTIGGYGDIVSHDAAEFETAGAAAAAKAELLGTAEDASTANTIHGAKKGVEEAKAAATAAQSAADAKIANVTAADNSVEVSGDASNKKVKVKLDPDEGNALKLTATGLKVELGAAPEYTIEKEAAATEGYFASYVLKKDGAQAGVKIDIPKDYLVKSASIKESAGEEDPSSLPAGTKYIDFVINAKEGSGQESHLYLNVNDLVDAYVPGNGIHIDSGSNTVSAVVVAENGLSVDGSGIKLAVASASVNGAMSSAHFSKVEGIQAGAQVNVIEGVQINGEDQAVTGKKVNLPLATAAKVGLVKVDDTSIAVDAAGTLKVKAVSTDLLTQGEDVLVLDCGSSL